MLVFSLPKLIFDNEVCGQALRLLKETAVVEDLPTRALVQSQLDESHLITAPHTLTHWTDALYLPGPVFDRKNRESWQREGEKSLWDRAVAEGDRRLAVYQPIETDPHLDSELRRLIRGGMTGAAPLPYVPPPPSASGRGSSGGDGPARRTRMRERRG